MRAINLDAAAIIVRANEDGLTLKESARLHVAPHLRALHAAIDNRCRPRLRLAWSNPCAR